MLQSASEAGISPLGLSFTGSLRLIRRALPQFPQAATEDLHLFYRWLVPEILYLEIPPPQFRSNPRVLEKTRSKFLNKKRCHRGTLSINLLLCF
jgi:hypothetical protein